MEDQIGYTIHLTPPQLKVVHTALKSLLDDFGHDEAQVARAIHEVLEKLPDEHSIRAIQI
jgi:UDP-N-acetylmuramyl pentapeptide synthase